MKIEVLLATMFYEKESEDFLDVMNIQTDMIIGNQCDYTENREFVYKGNRIAVLSREERGVGKNRNTCLFYSNADIVLFADNDVCYNKDYGAVIENYYRNNPKADVVIFNFKEKRGDAALQDINTKNKKATLRDITKFGTYAVTARRESILNSRISFSLLFGGGAKYSCGEDTLFLIDCYNKGLQIYLSDSTLGTVIHKESTWFKGVNEKYVLDKGALFRAINPRLYRLYILRHVLKHRKMYAAFGDIKKTYKTMLKGTK